MKSSLTTRILHAALAAAIVHQLVVSWFMEEPKPGRPENLAFELHETVGLVTLGLLAAFWLWAMVRRREEGLGALLPWFSAERRRRVVADFGAYRANLARRRLPSPGGPTPLASAIHGLGLLVATAMALTGGMVYAVMGADGSLSGTGHLVLELHEILSNLMWAYLIGHAGIAIVHDILGHRVIGRMFLGQE